jgi:hypothetical protein
MAYIWSFQMNVSGFWGASLRVVDNLDWVRILKLLKRASKVMYDRYVDVMRSS